MKNNYAQPAVTKVVIQKLNHKIADSLKQKQLTATNLAIYLESSLILSYNLKHGYINSLTLEMDA